MGNHSTTLDEYKTICVGKSDEEIGNFYDNFLYEVSSSINTIIEVANNGRDDFQGVDCSWIEMEEFPDSFNANSIKGFLVMHDWITYNWDDEFKFLVVTDKGICDLNIRCPFEWVFLPYKDLKNKIIDARLKMLKEHCKKEEIEALQDSALAKLTEI